MNLNWDELTAPQFARAVRKTGGVCVVPLGVLEKHGNHLPLGTDVQVVRRIAEAAVARAPALLFPALWAGQIAEARHVAGTIALRHEVYWSLLENLCEEIARNGCRKIILLNGHGGNESWLHFFGMTRLERPRDYTLYVARLGDYMSPALASPAWKKRMQSAFDHHAGEAETSSMLAVRPDRVRLRERGPAAPPRGRLAHLPRILVSGIWWYADYPEHYAGDAAAATADKGEWLLAQWTTTVATMIRAVRGDDVAAALEKEFFRRAAAPSPSPRARVR
jgi:creatinine amidohydrolase